LQIHVEEPAGVEEEEANAGQKKTAFEQARAAQAGEEHEKEKVEERSGRETDQPQIEQEFHAPPSKGTGLSTAIASQELKSKSRFLVAAEQGDRGMTPAEVRRILASGRIVAPRGEAIQLPSARKSWRIRMYMY